jgi:integrase
MPKRQLTDRFCAHAKVREGDVQTDYFDEETPGLALRVSRTRKAWTYLYSTRNGRRRRFTFGTYPATSLAAVRAKIDSIKGEIEAGIEPQAPADTFKSICEEYLRRNDGLRTASDRARTLERLVWPALGGTVIGDIRRSDIVRLLDRIEDENGPVMADRTLALVRKIMNWHASRSDEFRSPIVMGMARTRPKDRQRDRILSDDELRALWAACDGPFGAMVRFILLTGARRTEASEMQWGEITGRDWCLPAARNKAKVDLVRPLSQAALDALPSRAGEFVFSTDGGGTPISGFSKMKRQLDRASGVNGYTLHDCRRSARTLLSRAGVGSDVAERCLGHVIGGVRGVYDRHEFYAEKARAFEALASLVERIVHPSQRVVPMVRP